MLQILIQASRAAPCDLEDGHVRVLRCKPARSRIRAPHRAKPRWRVHEASKNSSSRKQNRHRNSSHFFCQPRGGFLGLCLFSESFPENRSSQPCVTDSALQNDLGDKWGKKKPPVTKGTKTLTKGLTLCKSSALKNRSKAPNSGSWKKYGRNGHKQCPWATNA